MIDWFDLLEVLGTLRSLLQCHSPKASILWSSAFFIVQLSDPCTTGKTIASTRRTLIGKVMSLLFNMLSRFVISNFLEEISSEVKSLSRARLYDHMDSSLHQAPPSMGFSRQKYWSGLPFPSPGKEKKDECQRTDAFKLWCWRRPSRVPWTVRRSNQSILKETNPEYSLEGQMLKLKLQYFGYLMRRVDSSEKTLMLGKIEGRRRRG